MRGCRAAAGGMMMMMMMVMAVGIGRGGAGDGFAVGACELALETPAGATKSVVVIGTVERRGGGGGWRGVGSLALRRLCSGGCGLSFDVDAVSVVFIAVLKFVLVLLFWIECSIVEEERRCSEAWACGLLRKCGRTPGVGSPLVVVGAHHDKRSRPLRRRAWFAQWRVRRRCLAFDGPCGGCRSSGGLS